MSKKKICYVSTHGFSLRMISQTNLLGKLNKYFNVSLILIKHPGNDFVKYLNKNNIKLYFLNDPINYNEYNFSKKYFVENFLSNIALMEKHKRAVLFNKSLNPWKRLRPFLYIFLHRLALKFKFIFSFHRFLTKKILHDNNYLQLIDEIDPDVLISTYPVDIKEAKLIFNAKQKNILTITHLLSWDNITAKGRFDCLSDKFFVWGGVMEDELIDLYKIKKENITKCGVPHFDIYNRKISNFKKNNLISKYKLNPEIPYIIFGMSSPYFAPLEIEIVEKISHFLEQRDDINLQMLIRPHPQNVQGYLSDKSWLPRLKKLDHLVKTSVFYPDLADGKIPWQMKSDDLIELSTAIKGASGVLNTCSTFAIDGIMNNKPVIMTPFDSDSSLNYWISARKHIDVTHINKFISINKPYIATSYKSLFEILSNDLKITYNDKQIRYYNYGFNDDSTEITINNLKVLLNA